MRIDSIKNNYKSSQRPVKNVFRGSLPSQIERKLYQELGINAKFCNNQLIADCVNETVEIFKRVLGKSFLPQIVSFISFSQRYKNSGFRNAYGVFEPSTNGVYINSDLKCFNNFSRLVDEKQKGHYYLFPDEKSTYHPLHTFVHEFAHCAHYKNLVNIGKSYQWDWLANKKISKSEFQDDAGSLGKYAQTDLLEFFAEKLTKEVLDNTLRNYPDGNLYKGSPYLKTISYDGDINSYEINTYNIWQGNKEKIEENLSKRVELSNKIDDAKITFHLLRW